MKLNLLSRLTPLALSLGLAIPAPSQAQTAPDAGQTLQQTLPPTLQAPRPAAGVTVQPPADEITLPGGQQVTINSLHLGGNSVFSEATLLAVLGDVLGRPYDLAGLRGLTAKIGEHYRSHGYPFARAFLPAQTLTDGVLHINIVEGRFGKVSATGDADLAPRAQQFLGGLPSGAVIESAQLERATLILDDQPGIKTAPLIRPGQEVGTGDLVVNVSREPMVTGDVGLDNHGNRYTGEHRLRANVQFDSPFTLGDQITVKSLASEEGMWLGNLGYSLPLGVSGLRGSVGYAHTYYQLAKDFANLQSHGTAKVTSAGLSYPLVRSQKANITLGASWQHKKLNDRQDAVGTSNDKSSNSLPISVQFDQRDTLGGGGISYGTLAYTPGRLSLDAALEAADRASNTDTRGRFDKWNLDLARMQATPMANLSLFGRASAQWAGKNLDSSESFSLGGASGVRAYPNGEGNGDAGWFIQLEARYQMGDFSPYVFHDTGKVKVNADAGRITPAVTNNTRSLAGSGLGLRYSTGPWSADASLAWRTHGGKPQSDSADRNPHLWGTMSYRF
ncbi:MAG: ShlB/FhaC/HecB family hemolysin secretion/activation protein [Gallionella sp.]|nr:ShlB/FhaC/HecB family hemolysin secretion/activation protein [Gallionella sp.]